MKILVYGAGPLGSLKAARLHEAGHDVSVLSRGQRLDDLREHGIVISEEGSDEEEVTHVDVVESLEPDDQYDLVLVVMRKDHVVRILETLAENRSVPTFLFMGNNAAGADELVAALGEERVMLGFPYPGGNRDGHVMRVLRIDEERSYTIPIGEVDGSIRPRTRRVADVLRSMRGYDVEIRTDMERWLRYHVALLIPGLVPALYAADTEMKRLGETRDLLVLSVRATKEALRGLRAAGYAPSPPVVRLFEYVPEPIWVYTIGWLMRREYAKVSIEGHSRQGRGEMQYLYGELRSILDDAGGETDAIDRLAPYFDPETPPYPEGRRELRVNWAGIAVPALALGALAFALAASARKRSRDGDSTRLDSDPSNRRRGSPSESSTRRYESDLGGVFYELTGPEDATTVVFTHGFALDHGTWRGQVDELAGSYRLLTWDLPGCGESDGLNEPLRLGDAADCLLGILEEEGIERAVLVGQSMGSLVHQQFADSHPDRVRGLVHVGGYPLHDGFSNRWIALYEAHQAVLKRLPARSIPPLFGRIVAHSPPARAYAERASSTTGKENMLYLEEGLIRDLAAGISDPIDRPQLIVVGDRENALLRKKAGEWCRDLAECDRATIADAGHLANHDNPAAVNEVLSAFLRELE